MRICCGSCIRPFPQATAHSHPPMFAANLASFSWTWELKSVNGRNLDLRCRFPGGYDALEPFARTTAAELLKRGNVNAALTVNQQDKAGTFRINEAALAQVEQLMAGLRQR